ncbi:hypothetical protein G6F26_010093 [Rhizopus arrhizus]|nr:hypothetical protein G6F26_010093 [Rhizopus arrhizus]
MYKSIIQHKKAEVIKKRQEYSASSSSGDSLCKDCKDPGHYSKQFYKCKFYVEATADDVGTSRKRKQTNKIKRDKKKAKRPRTGSNMTEPNCSSCKQEGHKSSRSPACPNHMQTKKETFLKHLGPNYKTYTRKLPFDQCVQSTYQTTLKSKIVSACEDVRNIVDRSQLFVNFYIPSLARLDSPIPHKIYEQNFCSNKSYPNIIYDKKPASDVSHCISEASKQLQATYTNNVVELFESRICKYIFYKTQNIFISMDRSDVVKIVPYVYQHVYQGVSVWPQGPAIAAAKVVFPVTNSGMDDLTPNENNKILFGNTIKFDGFSVDFVFYRKERMNNGSDLELTLEDFNYEEVHNQYHPMFLGPGRKSLFTAVVGVASAKQIRKPSCSGIKMIESQIPTPKSAAVGSYDQYVKHMLTHLDKLLDFYGKDTAHHRSQLYQGQQMAPEMMANMLTHGTAKYNRSRRKRKKKKKDKNDKKEDEGLSLLTDEKKLKWKPLPFQENKEKYPLVVFGAGVFGKDMVKMKRLRCGVIGKLFATLKKREAAGELIVVTIDEFKTSKTCSSCFFDDLKVAKPPGFKGKCILSCSKCKKVW